MFKPYVAQFASWLSLPADCTAHLMSGMAGMEMPARLQDATWEEVLLELVPSWIEKGTRLPEFQFAKPQAITREEIEKVPGWNEKGTKLLPKKLGYVVGVLALCVQPISLARLMESFDYKNRKTFRENYINPLKGLKFIEATIPDKPSAPDNKYVTTERGKAFLMGR